MRYLILQIVLIIQLICWLYVGVAAQLRDSAWLRAMRDPNANFFETQRLFEQAWRDRPREKGDGWKPFKRWEYWNSRRVQEDGYLPPPDQNLREWLEYIARSGKRDQTGTGNWTPIGPISLAINGTGQPNGVGRISAIQFHPTDAQTIFVGSPWGGLWKSTDGGNSWISNTDQLPSISVSCIQINPTNPNIMYIGTGDRDGGDGYGVGVLKSIDGGATWALSNTGMGNRVVNELLMHPANPNILIAGTSNGVYRSINGGATWTIAAGGLTGGDVMDVAFHPTAPDTVYAFRSNNQFWRSIDNGINWIQITSGLPTTDVSRMVIGVSAANPNYVYLLAASGTNGFKGIYRSTDRGLNFTTRMAYTTTPNNNILGYNNPPSGNNGQGWYDLCIAVSPVNAEQVYVGGINLWRSTNGGTSFPTCIGHWVGTGAPPVHADQHVLKFSPHNGNLYVGNDGGLYRTANPTGAPPAWTDLSSGLAIAQMYRMGQSQNRLEKVITGHQDNGTFVYTNGSWSTEYGGDGMECLVDYTDDNYMYGSLYYGEIFRSTNGGISFPTTITTGIPETGNWVTPFALHTTNPAIMFVGMNSLWRTTNVKTGTPTWTAISASATSRIAVIEVAPSNGDIVWYSRNDNNIFYTTNATAATPTWTAITEPGTGTISDIEIHATNPNIIWITRGSKVWKSINNGVTWTDISGTLPNMPANCLLYDQRNPNDGIYLGTDAAVWYRDNTMSNWVLFNNGLPNTSITELEIFYHPTCPGKDKLRASTYGRGAWQSDLRAPNVAPIACFDISSTNICLGGTLFLTDQSAYNPTSWSWNITGPGSVTYVGSTSATSQNPQVVFGALGNYNITLTATNAFGTHTGAVSTVTVVALPTGVAYPFTQNFNGTWLPAGWTRIPAAAPTWAQSGLNTGADGAGGNRAAMVNSYAYATVGQQYELRSPNIDLTTVSSTQLTFDVAHAQYPGAVERLQVYVLDVCTGISTPVYDKAGNVLATVPSQTSEFFPAAAGHWRNEVIDLTPYCNRVIALRFVETNQYGNNVYIDNINISCSKVTVFPYLESFELGSGCWAATGTNSSWQWGTPNPGNTLINNCSHGTRAWVTNLNGNYNSNELSYLTSPAFDLSGFTTAPVLSFSHVSIMENGPDQFWVEYSDNGGVWTKMGVSGGGRNWYNVAGNVWTGNTQNKWRVSSYDIPVFGAGKTNVRFRFVFQSNGTTTAEGVGIDQVHIHAKTPIYTGAGVTGLTAVVSGSNWVDFNSGGQRVLSIHPMGQNLGNTTVGTYIFAGPVRSINGWYYLDRNWIATPTNQPSSPVKVRVYFLDTETNTLMAATGCGGCANVAKAYDLGITKYSGPNENGTLADNSQAPFRWWSAPNSAVTIVPYDNGYYCEFEVSSFSEIWTSGGVTPAASPLPIEGLDFTAQRTGAQVLLNWQDANSNRSGYVLERKLAHEFNFEAIGIHPATAAAVYHHLDENRYDGSSYYRLKITDITGQVNYSEVREVGGFEGKGLQIQLYPNPASQTVNLTVTSGEKLEISLIDGTGRKLRSFDNYSGGQYNRIITLNLSGLATGMYYIRVIGENGVGAISKLMIE